MCPHVSGLLFLNYLFRFKCVSVLVCTPIHSLIPFYCLNFVQNQFCTSASLPTNLKGGKSVLQQLDDIPETVPHNCCFNHYGYWFD